MTRLIIFDAVTLTFDPARGIITLWPMCVLNLRTMHPVSSELPRSYHFLRHATGGFYMKS